jgi:hypothetical protein
MRTLLALVAAVALTASASSPLQRPQPESTRQASPFGLFWSGDVTNLSLYSRPGSIVVAGNCNRYDPMIQKSRADGAELLTYLNVIEVYDQMPCKLIRGFYMGDGNKVPLWPWPTYGARVNWPKTHLADMRAGSKWSDNVVNYVVELMKEDKVDGVFLDNLGARLWTRAKWREWSPEEQKAWTEGNIDLARRIDEARRKINPNFIVVGNNIWDLSDKGNKSGFAGEKYIDGVMIERSNFNDYHRWYAGRTFSDLGHRRVLIMAKNPEDVEGWSHVPGVTHVSFQKDYRYPPTPELPFTALNDRPRR